MELDGALLPQLYRVSVTGSGKENRCFVHCSSAFSPLLGTLFEAWRFITQPAATLVFAVRSKEAGEEGLAAVAAAATAAAAAVEAPAAAQQAVDTASALAATASESGEAGPSAAPAVLGQTNVGVALQGGGSLHGHRG